MAREPKEPTKLGAFVLDRMSARGMRRQVDLVRASGVSDATVSRLIFEPIAPEAATLAKVAVALGIDEQEFVLMVHQLATAGDSVEPESLGPSMHSLAIELDRMLSDNSPIGADDRAALETIVDRVIEPYRRLMRRRRTAS